jgi:surfeit locus 1 family protein
VNRRWYRPSWFAIALLGAGLGVFSYLGTWQLKRASEKAALLAAYAKSEQDAPISLEEARRRTASEQYPHVRTMGQIDPVHSYVLDDQIRDGRQGVLVYAVLQPEDGSKALLVNRGFLPRVRGAALPPLPSISSDLQPYTGLYAPPPGTGLRMGGDALLKQTSWPKLTIYIDPDEISKDIGKPLDDRVLLLDADPASGFEREWTPQILPPERHRGYAFQWFSFAVAAIAIFIVLHWRRPKPESR